ncbi:MAG: hypothetical protein RMJ59_06390 [Candidatus Nitrosocaldus sp.]|nr:hypothetical protein [Candidatus Nitrosocaldus sp.]MDW8275988.1 hypothetical protein [Candidatus Nitrosocaldus sp.]
MRVITVAIVTAMVLLLATVTIKSYAQQSLSTPTTQPFQIPDMSEDLKVLTVTGRDLQGNTVSMELIISRGTMMMARGSMMMDPMMMFGMPMMMQMMMQMQMMGMDQGMGMGMGMGQAQMQQMQQQMNAWMRSHYIVQGGSIAVGDSTYMIEVGNARISDDGRVFVNAVVDQGLNRNGKVMVWGTLDKDDGLKGRVLLWEGRTQLNNVKFTAIGSVEDVL